ncbi:hypothetical protein JYU34_008381 [Plutella xylostella]|uniref:Uncharacterized protein n=1 Tax=Plutella xylostella TaxID=51655 RepID=A0ABQ7QKT6_PLUXY|nr:hypothetical protein JYU34_008381 [Plutella xylostella]
MDPAKNSWVYALRAILDNWTRTRTELRVEVSPTCGCGAEATARPWTTSPAGGALAEGSLHHEPRHSGVLVSCSP